MAWITPTDSQVLQKTSKERAAIAAAKGGTDDLPQILFEVVCEFRDAIAGRENPVDQGGTLPAGLAKYARDLALWIFITRGVPKNEGIQTKQREEAATAADKILEGIRNGSIAIEPPTGYTDTTGQNWNSENKLIMRTHPVPPPSVQEPAPSPNNQPYANPDAPVDGSSGS